MNAIVMDDATARIELDECVECGVCRRVAVCPVDAIEPPPFFAGRRRQSQSHHRRK
jgi:ferredoxin